MGSILSLFEKQEATAAPVPLRHRPTTLSSAFAEELDIEAGKNAGEHNAGAAISVGVGQN